MIFLLTQEIIKMWNRLVLCKLCKTLKNILEGKKGGKRTPICTCFHPGVTEVTLSFIPLKAMGPFSATDMVGRKGLLHCC